MDLTLAHARARDAADPLASHRDRFVHADDRIYLDGNSLGRLPRATVPAIADVVERQWGAGLIGSWPRWLEDARETADLLGRVVLGVEPGQVHVGDSTTVSLYRLAVAAVRMRPGRTRILVEADAFPTDLYVLDGVARDQGLEVTRIPAPIDDGVRAEHLAPLLDESVALVCLTHVHYRSGALLDLAGLTSMAHEVGALTLWDLCHSAGSVEVPLAASGADLAVGCTYKHLNAGPGAPAFSYVRADLLPEVRSPIQGWFSQADQFAMAPDYDPVAGIDRIAAGTPDVRGIAAVREGVRTIEAAGLPAVRAKGAALGDWTIALADAWLAPLGFRVASPRDAAMRGSHVVLEHPEAWRACQAWIDAGVVPDFRTPDRLRIGLAALTTSFEDVWVGLDRLRAIVAEGRHLAYPTERGRVT
ncbi:kynureninase [Agrococcus sp. SGAir0287]|uniref:kynureninase n=1 Tax=Agrococcus sp. SGAir0287 TaxID=2070347 RepID=UPI0010CCDD1D|nr:aminotransferase class V-fold PLP-dependent enzyme [Agrococcus sp. SGAir0287]QCR18538.1 kynureninase [Agrococcus sp. SGAir0287]